MAAWRDNLRHSYLPLGLIAVTGFLTLGATLQLLYHAWSRQLIMTSLKWQIGLVLLAILMLFEIAAFRIVLTSVPGNRRGLNASWRAGIAELRFARGLILAFIVLLPTGIFLFVDEAFTSMLFVRLFITWIFIIAGAEILSSIQPRYSWLLAACGVALMIGIFYRLGLLAQEISAYPFSQGWSEASRYYYASLFFSRRIYGFQVSPSVLHPTRYLLQSIPFIIPGMPVIAHRIWQVLLWITTTVGASYLLGRRLNLNSRVGYAMMIGLGILYLFQGPVYYHLLFMVILVLSFFNRGKPWRSLAVILLASAWAGISRVNWYPVPAMLGITLYALEDPGRKQSLLDYVKWPAIWFGLGTATAFLAQVAYIAWSGQPAEQFSSSFSSGLLWYRLFPNATYPLGVLLAVLLASFPALLLFWLRRRKLTQNIAWYRTLTLFAVSSALLAGGLVVSVKIGGGSNLHNLDAYLVVLGLIAAYVYSGKLELEGGQEDQEVSDNIGFLPLFILVPLIFTLSQGGPVRLPGKSEIDRSLDVLREYAQDSDEAGRRILFISQRHLLTFGTIEHIELIPDYETVFLMEMAMAGNEAYLSRFRDDLSEQRFDVIVVDPLTTALQGRAHSFGEENDAWVREVSLPVLCYYDPVETFPETRVQILLPREVGCSE